MASAHSVLLKVALKILSLNTSANASHVIVPIDPLDLVHAAAVDRDNHASLSFVQLQRFRDICATSIGDKYHVVLHGKFDQVLSILC